MGKVAFVFSGQGAQYPGMGKDLYSYSEAFKKVMDLADKKILDICFDGPEDILNMTINTQPCVFLTGLGCAEALKENGIHCDAVAGFSIGELAALAYAKAFSYSDAYSTVLLRAHIMEKCAKENPGVMYAVIGGLENKVLDLCEKVSNCYPVNFNCPGQIVVSMSKDSENDFLKLSGYNGIKTVKLNVSGAFHSPFMKKAEDALIGHMSDIEFVRPVMPVYSNLLASPYEDDYMVLCKQVSNPVLWEKSIRNMINDGFDTFIETGSKKVLSNMIKRTDKYVRVFNVYDTESLKEVVHEFRS